MKRTIVVLSMITLFISLTQPGFFLAKKEADLGTNTTFLFLLGWSGILGGSLESLFWIANPIYLVALFHFINERKRALWESGLAAIIALSFSALNTFPTSESGARSKIISFGLGYKLWVLSFMILAVGALISRIVEKKKATVN